MKRKSASKLITLVLIGSLIASCSEDKKDEQVAYMRADSSAPYSQTNVHSGSHANGMLTGMLMYHAFSSLNSNGSGGYHSNSISERANLGSNSTKTSSYSRAYPSSRAAAHSSSSRGGFGHSSFSAGS